MLVPVGSTKCLPKESFIQCFNEVLRLDVGELTAGHARGKVSSTGKLGAFLHRVRETVENSDVLEPQDIEDILHALDAAGIK